MKWRGISPGKKEVQVVKKLLRLCLAFAVTLFLSALAGAGTITNALSTFAARCM